MNPSMILTFVAHAAFCGSADASPGVKLVTELYKAYAWEMTIVEPLIHDSVYQASHSELERYFAPELASLIVRDRECAKRSGGICRIDFSILWNSQDSGAYDVRIRPGSDDKTVLVSYTYSGNQQEIKLTYTLAKHDGGSTKISDIQYDGGHTLRQLLSKDIGEED